MHTKQRANSRYRAPVARIGYRKIATVRGLPTSGVGEVLIHKPSGLEGVDPERQTVRVGSRVGNRKRMQIHDRADDLGLRILNRRRIERRGDLLRISRTRSAWPPRSSPRGRVA